jgi:hypothetical protein
VFVDDAFAVFLEEVASLRRQEIDHRLRGPAQANAPRRDHQRSVQKNGMGRDGVEQRVVAQRGIVQPQLTKRRSLLAKGLADREAGSGK